MQTLVSSAPPAHRYYSDQLAVYATLVYESGIYQAMPNKSETYAVEADNAELRHYLARLARSSRCFSRSLQALREAVKLFVFAWNRRQLAKRMHPRYTYHLADFLYP